LCHTHQSQDPQYKRNPSFTPKKKEKKLSIYISTDQIHDLPNFLYSNHANATKKKTEEKRNSSQPASQPTSQGIPSYLKTTKSIFHQKKKEIKKLSEISSCAD
jgi:CRISPR/Cas system-associated protein Cas7 (RAMP superfamily)